MTIGTPMARQFQAPTLWRLRIERRHRRRTAWLGLRRDHLAATQQGGKCDDREERVHAGRLRPRSANRNAAAHVMKDWLGRQEPHPAFRAPAFPPFLASQAAPLDGSL
jgi:hypothetical protein